MWPPMAGLLDVIISSINVRLEDPETGLLMCLWGPSHSASHLVGFHSLANG